VPPATDSLLRARRESGDDRMAGGEMRGTYGDLMKIMRQKGYRPTRELLGEMMVQKLYRTLCSENQLTEVLTDFWFNHFNVSITDNETRVYVPAYERTPRAATCRSPPTSGRCSPRSPDAISASPTTRRCSRGGRADGFR
jgi:Protein of unknown function (DUF1800)